MKFRLIPSLAFICLLPGLLALGFWQLSRANEKQLYLDLEAQRVSSGIVNLFADAEGHVDKLRYRKATVTGLYDVEHQILIDNQINAGKPGYYVLTPFVLEGANKAVLVNRGWVSIE